MDDIPGFRPINQRDDIPGFRPHNQRDDITFHWLYEVRLVELDVCITTRRCAKAFHSCLFMLPGLKSLSVDQRSIGSDPLEMADNIAVLTKLTRLSLKGSSSVGSLHRLTEMVDLEIGSHQDILTDLLDALLHMPKLTSLKIASLHSERVFRFSAEAAFRLCVRLTALKTLVLRSVSPEGACIEALWALPDLTELRFDRHKPREDLPTFYAQLSLLSSLQVLEVPISWPFADPQVKLLSGCLPRLREIRFRDDQLNADERVALQRAFPCLRRLPPS